MAIDPELLEILVCPETHESVEIADEELLRSINERVRAGVQKNRSGELVKSPVAEALIRKDGKCVYLVEDGIPNMLIEERIDL
jgi:uncharacterized protein YbaR (Trm112 family)